MRTIARTAAALAQGVTSSVALCEELLDRAQASAGEGARAFVALDRAKVLAQAQAADALRKVGVVPSPLAGVPISIKDLFDVQGEVTAAGSAVLRNAPPARADAPVIARLRAAGAVLFGRTNMTEFAFSGLGLNPHYDTPRSPWDRATGRIPGGSSSGGAVSVADGMAVAALGTDTGGSTRIPAAFCGIVGYKPTARRIPTAGVLPLSWTLDSVGPMAASVECCALIDAVLAGTPPLAPAPVQVQGLSLGVPRTLVLDGLEPAVATAFERTLARLAKAGARIQEFALAPFGELPRINRAAGIAPVEACYVHRERLANAGERFDQRVRKRILGGEAASALDYIGLLDIRKDWIARVEAEIAAFDAIVLPTVAITPPAIAPLLDDDDLYVKTNGMCLRNTSAINLLDGCAISLPCHTPGDAPVGFMIAAAGGNDARVLAIGRAVEALLAAS